MGYSYDEETRKAAVAIYRDRTDLSVEDASILAGVSRRTMQAWAREAGLPPRPPRTPGLFDDAEKAKAVRLYLGGEPMWRIEGATGMGEGSIRSAVRAAGHDLRTCHTNARVRTEDAIAMAEKHGVPEAARRLGCSPEAVRYHLRKVRS